MEKRRNEKSNAKEYKRLDAEIRKDCQSAKENIALAEQCQMIEQLDLANKSQKMSTPIRESNWPKARCRYDHMH